MAGQGLNQGDKIDRLVQEKLNSDVLAMELRLSCTNPSKCLIKNIFSRRSCSVLVRKGAQIKVKKSKNKN